MNNTTTAAQTFQIIAEFLQGTEVILATTSDACKALELLKQAKDENKSDRLFNISVRFFRA